MKYLGEVLKLSTEFLSKKNIVKPRRQAEELIASVLKMKRIDLYMHFDRPMEDRELEQCREGLQRRSKGEPLEYIIGKIDFYNCSFEVNPSVLIPRPETEILLDKAVGVIQGIDLSGKVAWDVCTGSGVLGICLKKRFPLLEVSISDISSEALAIAKKNITRNQVSIEVLQGDLLTPFAGRRADFLFCNPPYVSVLEYAALDPEVRAFEPRLALVGGDEGLEFYSRLSVLLPQYLNSKAKVFFEIGSGQGESVRTGQGTTASFSLNLNDFLSNLLVPLFGYSRVWIFNRKVPGIISIFGEQKKVVRRQYC